MFNFLKWLFGSAPKQNYVEQTGVINEQPADLFLSGTIPYVIRNEKGDWEKFLPDGEQQNLPFEFDSKSCVTFSFLNSAEAQIMAIPLPEEHQKFLQDNGYYRNGRLNFSDIFTAIRSGTSENGNSYPKVGGSIRHDGLVPDLLLSFNGQKTFLEWHNPAQITQALIDLGKKFTEYFDAAYELTVMNSEGDIDEEEEADFRYHLKQSPLSIAVPRPATHAIMMPNFDNVFESYAPFYRKRTRKIHYAYKLVITPKKVATVATTLRLGNKGEDVKKLQRWLGIPADGVFGKQTEQALKKYQASKGLTPDGIFGPKTRALFNGTDKKDLVSALIEVESQGNDNAIGDHHLADKAYGCLQIRKPCVDDVNRAFGTSYKAQDMLGNRELSKTIFERYMSLYATEKAIGRAVTDEDRARIWNGGPTGWKRSSTLSYWSKVKALL